ncbi:MAG: cyclic nucleotide-binding domain-containing protein [Magnetococcales bacterium]|nr:cyclic nucleotide-binding domain-containing protein [Magnetococcales bacterium]
MRTISGLDLDELLGILDSQRLFRIFTADEKEILVQQEAFITLRRYDKGEFLIREGTEEARGFYLLLAGFASVVKTGTSIPLATLGPGDFFGEISFLTGRPRATNVIVHAPRSDPDMPPPELSPEVIHHLADGVALAIRFGHDVLEPMGTVMRGKLKDQVIRRLLWILDEMHRKISDLSHEEPEFEIEEDLNAILEEDTGASISDFMTDFSTMENLTQETLERVRDRLITRLAEHLEVMNDRIVALST